MVRPFWGSWHTCPAVRGSWHPYLVGRPGSFGGGGTYAPLYGIEVPNDPGGGPWQTDPRRWSKGHPGDHAAAGRWGHVPRDRSVTPPCCERGGVTRSFSCRSAGGGDGTGSSTGHTGHRLTAISVVGRRAELARPRLPGVVAHAPHTRSAIRARKRQPARKNRPDVPRVSSLEPIVSGPA